MSIDFAIQIEQNPNKMHMEFFDILVKATCKGLKHPVKLSHRQINLKNDDSAYCTFDGGMFEVVIDPRLCFGSRISLWLHEVAHLQSPWDEKEDHSKSWGVEYAKAYRTYLDVYASFWHTEIWKPVNGFPRHEVSNFGNVRSITAKVFVKGKGRGAGWRTIKGRRLNTAFTPTGGGSSYYACTFSNVGKVVTKRVHNLVAEAFLGARPQSLYVLHGPLGSRCNHVANIRYGTASENQRQRRKDGTAGRKVIDETGKVYVNANAASEDLGIDHRLIGRVISGELRQTHGKVFEVYAGQDKATKRKSKR